MSDETRIGTVLYLFDGAYRPHDDSVSQAERWRGRFCPHVITGETRGEWLLAAGDGGWYEVNKKTLKLCGRDTGDLRMYTAQQVTDRVWEDIHRTALLLLIEKANAATLRKAADAIGYHPDE